MKMTKTLGVFPAPFDVGLAFSFGAKEPQAPMSNRAAPAAVIAFKRLQHAFALLASTPTLSEIDALRERRRKGELSFREGALYLVRETTHLVIGKSVAEKSAALTYTFILSIVPLLAIAFTFFKGFGGLQSLVDDTIKPLVSTHFAPAVALQLSEFLDFLLGQLDTKALSVVSFITFLGTVIVLLMNIEKCLNDVFGALKERSLFRKFTNYWVLMSFTPVVIAFSSVKSTELMQQFSFAQNFFGGLLGTFRLLDVARYFFGVGVELLGFLVLFGFMPNRRTSWRALLLGAAVTTVLFEGLQFVNVTLTRRSFADSSATEIYGTIPLLAVAFFVWIRLVWIVVLVGACVCMAMSLLLDESEETSGHAGVTSDLATCARIFEDACTRFETDNVPATFESIVGSRKLGRAEAERVLTWLLGARLLLGQQKGRRLLLIPTPKGNRLRHAPAAFLKEILRHGAPKVEVAPRATPTTPGFERATGRRREDALFPGDAFASEVLASLTPSKETAP